MRYPAHHETPSPLHIRPLVTPAIGDPAACGIAMTTPGRPSASGWGSAASSRWWPSGAPRTRRCWVLRSWTPACPVPRSRCEPPPASRLIARLRAAQPDMLVGAGTVLSAEQATRAIDAGAQFIVTPGFGAGVVSTSQARGVPVYPGVMTPTEVMAALDAGLSRAQVLPRRNGRRAAPAARPRRAPSRVCASSPPAASASPTWLPTSPRRTCWPSEAAGWCGRSSWRPATGPRSALSPRRPSEPSAPSASRSLPMPMWPGDRHDARPSCRRHRRAGTWWRWAR